MFNEQAFTYFNQAIDGGHHALVKKIIENKLIDTTYRLEQITLDSTIHVNHEKIKQYLVAKGLVSAGDYDDLFQDQDVKDMYKRFETIFDACAVGAQFISATGATELKDSYASNYGLSVCAYADEEWPTNSHHQPLSFLMQLNLLEINNNLPEHLYDIQLITVFVDTDNLNDEDSWVIRTYDTVHGLKPITIENTHDFKSVIMFDEYIDYPDHETICEMLSSMFEPEEAQDLIDIKTEELHNFNPNAGSKVSGYPLDIQLRPFEGHNGFVDFILQMDSSMVPAIYGLRGSVFVGMDSDTKELILEIQNF